MARAIYVILLLLKIALRCNAMEIIQEFELFEYEDDWIYGDDPVEDDPGQHVRFLLWTRDNPNEEDVIQLINVQSGNAFLTKPVNETVLRRGVPTKVLLHGFMNNGLAAYIQKMRDNYLTLGDFNVISVDWSNKSGSEVFDYPTAAGFVRPLGVTVAKMLSLLEAESVLSFSSVHVVGFSLGAHAAGRAGAKLKGRLQRVTGLDPAGFMMNMTSGVGLHSARFVDVVHTSEHWTSRNQTLGHADFFVNGGLIPQPGCDDHGYPYNILCSHYRAHEVFAESIGKPGAFKARRCSTWDAYVAGKCSHEVYAHMGDSADPRYKGSFFLRTNDRTPYSIDDGYFGFHLVEEIVSVIAV